MQVGGTPAEPPAGSVPEPRLTKIVSSISTDGGRTWTDHEVTAQRDASEPVSIYDPERRTFYLVYLVWHDNRNLGGRGRHVVEERAGQDVPNDRTLGTYRQLDPGTSPPTPDTRVRSWSRRSAR